MNTKFRIIAAVVALLLMAEGLALPAQAQPPAQGPPPPGPSDAMLIRQLNQESHGVARISYHAETGKVRFIGTSPDHRITQPAGLTAGASSETAARGFLAAYGRLFGLRDPAQELAVMRERSADRGRSFVRFQQVYRDIPVLGGELIVHMGAGQSLLSASGEILPDLDLDRTPEIEAASARQTALELIAGYYQLEEDTLATSEPELWIYNPALLGAPGPRLSRLVWRIEVTPLELLPIRELVLVDARQGLVALHFNQIDTARNRLIYDNQNNPAYGIPGNGPARTEGEAATGITDVDNAYDYAGATYDFYWSRHNRDSIDGAGMSLVSTTRYCPNSSPCPYPNAFWNGSQMVFGQGFASADDVVAHEMTHGVTQHESGLFYYMQSGAINESFSDIWGEFVDLTYTNGNDDDSPDVRWLMGEDIGAFRSMSSPPTPRYYDPDRMGSSYYYCGEADGGGVHSNSGVSNKAAYLMVDGGNFNGHNVTGIGLDKTAKIYYEVQTNLFTSAGDYQDLYDALYQACTNLIGSSGITAADCQEVRDATLATEMNQQPGCCPAPHAPVCDSGSPTDLFFDDLEAGVGNWTSAAIVGSDEWYYEDDYATSGTRHLYGYNYSSTADYYAAMTSDVALPSGSTLYLHFNHAYAFHDFGATMYDGGVIEYSINGGSSWNDAGALFSHNGYSGTLYTGGTNPLKGRQAFGGESDGYFSSRLDLSSLAGHNVRFRFRIGTDSAYGAYGWFIDDVRIYTCGAQANTPPAIFGLPDQVLFVDNSRDNAIDLWVYADDPDSADSELTYSIDNTPDPNAGVTMDNNRYIDINPTPGWMGQTYVTIRIADPGGLSDTGTFSVISREGRKVFLPIILSSAQGVTFEDQLISLINAERSSRGLGALSAASILMQVAEAHSQDMVDRGFFKHTNPDGLGYRDRVTNAGYTWSYVGETIGAGDSTPQAMVDAWMGSSEHRDIILSTSPTEIGVGYVAGGSYGHYWTAVFATPAP